MEQKVVALQGKRCNKSMAPMAKPRRNGGKWHVMELAHSVALKGFFDKPPPAVKKPRSGAAAPASVPASDREDEATMVDMTQPREIEAFSELPQQDGSGKSGFLQSVAQISDRHECGRLPRVVFLADYWRWRI